jgi:hypothetical protein
MAISLYDMSVAPYLQTIGAVAGFLQRGLDHCRDNDIDPAEMVESQLCGDMLPLRFQILSVANHSLAAIEGVKNGVFAPKGDSDGLDYAGLQKLVADTQAGLQKLTPAEVNALEDAEVVFQMRDFKMPFTAVGFVTSFSLPNFYFHASTAYDILRAKGVPLGKRDFLGQLRMKS